MTKVNKDEKITPPLWAKWLLNFYCRAEVLESLEGDLNEYFERNVKSKGVFRARIIYIVDVIKFCRLYTIKRPKRGDLFSNVRLYRNYYKTSLRTIQHNKLFSTINVVGLSVSMCVALLLIAFFLEVRSFDNFHLNADRVLRVNSVLHENNGTPYNYASTSVLAEKRIAEEVTGIELIASLHRGFDKDITYENKTIPLNGFWASEDFLQIFSFEIINGNAKTALSEPNSIVLTKSSAEKIFNTIDVLGKIVQADTTSFTVTAVINDVPFNSHVRFDMLASFVTLDTRMTVEKSPDWLKWDNLWEHYVYILLDEKSERLAIQKTLEGISATENKNTNARKIDLYLEPLREIALTRNMSNSIGATVDRSTFTTLGILCVVVIISACFNYTNLSIARALRRTREIGIRKSVGASRSQVFNQFLFESIILSLIALVVAFGIFFLIRKQFIEMNSLYQQMITLTPTAETIIYFIGLAVVTGLLAGLIPAGFFSKLNTAVVLKDSSGITLFRNMGFRKVLIVFQYTLSIFFIVMVTIGYKQYRHSLSFDLGFNTENILAIDLQGNDPARVMRELEAVPEVTGIAQASYVSSVGISYSGTVKYTDPFDSTGIEYNFVDEQYLPLLQHKLLAGANFNGNASNHVITSQVIINQQMLAWMKIKDPRDAIGAELVIEGVKNTVIGVVEDFHHERVNYPIRNFAFRYDPSRFQVVNVKLASDDAVAAREKIAVVWNNVDPVHPIEAKFYSEHIEDAYNKMSWIIKIIGFITLLAISIASLGLLGMVVYTTETRMKEISVRKVLGASVSNLITIMSRSFIWLLIISTAISTPAGYFMMDKVVFNRLVYRAHIGIVDVGIGPVTIILLALLLIGWQTWNVAKTNPAKVLKNE